MKRVSAALLVFTVVLHGLGARAQVPVAPAFAAALQEKLDSCVNVFSVPGISATLLLPGNRFWNGASGVADIYTEAPMDTAYLFQMASVTKLFTAALIMRLVEEGELALDDTVGSILPAIDNVPGNMKIRYLLKHRSGLADILASPGAANSWLLDPNHLWDPISTIETFGGDPLFAQGAAFSYSNTNYVLLGRIIEEVTGTSLAEALRSRFFDPLAMDRTAFRPAEELGGLLVPGWSSLSQPATYTDDMTTFLSPCFSSMVGGAGALVSRPWDIARFNRALFSGALLASATMDTMRVCTNVNMGGGATGYGFGTMRYIFAGRTYFGHGGDINGFTQLSIHDQPDSVTLVLSINRNDAPRGPIAAAILGIAFEQLQVGVDDLADSDASFLMFPVPADGSVSLSLTGQEGLQRVELLDMNGRRVLSKSVNFCTPCDIDMGDVASGVYQVQVITLDGVQSRKLVVQH